MAPEPDDWEGKGHEEGASKVLGDRRGVRPPGGSGDSRGGEMTGMRGRATAATVLTLALSVPSGAVASNSHLEIGAAGGDLDSPHSPAMEALADPSRLGDQATSVHASLQSGRLSEILSRLTHESLVPRTRTAVGPVLGGIPDSLRRPVGRLLASIEASRELAVAAIRLEPSALASLMSEAARLRDAASRPLTWRTAGEIGRAHV